MKFDWYATDADIPALYPIKFEPAALVALTPTSTPKNILPIALPDIPAP